MSWEERVREFGEEVARQQREPYMAALERRKKVQDALRDYSAQHPMIFRLLALRDSVGRGKYE